MPAIWPFVRLISVSRHFLPADGGNSEHMAALLVMVESMTTEPG